MGNKRKSNKRKSPPPASPDQFSSDAESPGKPNGSAANSKRKAEPGLSPPKKQVSWSKESELALLKLIARFNAQSASDGASFSKKNFLAFIAKALAGLFTESQVYEKIKRLKRKYRSGDADRNPPLDPLEREIFDLAAKLWGPITSNGDVAVKQEQEELFQEIVPDEERTEKIDFDFGASDFGHSPDFLARATDLVCYVGTNSELERLKREIRVSELELFLKKSELLKKQLLMALEPSKSSSGK